MEEATRSFADRDDPPALPRPRRRLRTFVLSTVGVILALGAAGWFGGALYLHWQKGKSVAAVEAEVERIRAAGEPITPEDMEAWHRVPAGTTDATGAWLQAFAVMNRVKFAEKSRLPYVGKGEPEDLAKGDSQTLALAKRFMAAHQETIAATRRAAALGGQCRYPINFHHGRTGTFPHGLDSPALARILRLRFRVALEERNADRAIDSIQLHLALARTWDHEPSEIFQFVRCFLLNTAMDEVDDLLSALRLTDAQLIDLSDRLTQIPIVAPLSIGLIGERALGYHAFHHLPTLVVDEWTTPPTGEGKLRRPGDCYFYLVVLRENIKAVDLPFHEGRARVKELSDLIIKKVSSKDPMEKYGVVLTAQMAPQFPALFDAVARTQSLRDSNIAGIAFRRHQLKYGVPPDSLESLVPEFLTTVTVDPFGDGTRRLTLQVSDECFAIYSIGRDGIDDGALLSDRESIADEGFVAAIQPSHGREQ